MRLLILSDLHLEFEPLCVGKAIQSKYSLQFDLDIYRLIGKALSSSRNIIKFDNTQFSFI